MSNFANSDIQSTISGASYPCTGRELAEQAERDGADTNVVNQLRQLGDTNFETSDDVMKSIGG